MATITEAALLMQADAIACADDAFHNGGWRRAPAQSAVATKLIAGRNVQEVIALLGSWNRAYQARAMALADSEKTIAKDATPLPVKEP